MPDLILSPIAGPPMEPVTLSGVAPLTIGRSSGSAVRLNDPSVSRRHALLTPSAEGWTVCDSGSRHGVHLNSSALEPGVTVPFGPGDRLRIGPWLFRVRDATSPVTTHSIDDTGTVATSRVSRVEIGDLASRRLDLLMSVARSIQTTEDETEVARIVVESLVAGSGYERAVVIRPVRGIEEIDTLAAHHRGAPTPVRPSRTLIRAASEGGVARLEDQPPAQHAVSIISAQVASALCAPVTIGGEIDAYLYLDGAANPHADAAAFCAAVADLCALAISNLRRQTLQRQQDRLLRDLDTARRVQERLMPPGAGVAGPVRYTMHFQPGRVVAGDFFGVLRLDDDRAAVFIGDVAGKGLGASLLMATVQARLETLLETEAPLDEVVNRLSAYLADRSDTGEFATLFVGVLDARAGAMTCVDAGHGYVAVRRSSDAGLVSCAGGPPVGVDGSIRYEQTVVPVGAGDRVILMSDGVPEQPDPAGTQFGVERAIECLSRSTDPPSDVHALLAALANHAHGDTFADDVTIVSIARP